MNISVAHVDLLGIQRAVHDIWICLVSGMPIKNSEMGGPTAAKNSFFSLYNGYITCKVFACNRLADIRYSYSKYSEVKYRCMPSGNIR